ncbi:MAG: D-alanine--D-alanine ligase [Crocinitomicaceae bacterium]
MKNVGIIAGGYSSEYAISVLSATNIKNNFPKEYAVYLILMDKKGWSAKLDDDSNVPVNSSNLTFKVNGKEVKIDVAIVYIHGNPGENGKLQSYLEMIDVPYINSGPLASQLSFDKWYCNQFLRGFGYKVADSIYLNDANQPIDENAIIERLKLPLFVKPCDSGSSYGISRVNEPNQLKTAIDGAFKEGRTVVLERFLAGTEVTCGAYRSRDGLQSLPLVEIISENEFFDYQAKYEGLSQEITPARISDELTLEVQRITREVYDLLKLRSIARIDFMIENGVPYIIEVNTTPGFSSESLVPKMVKQAGKSIAELWQEIVEVEFIDLQ